MRENYINWDSYFMGIAILSSMRSKDPNTQVGACIVNEDKRIVGVGYNGLPKGCDDKEFPWERDGEFLNTKYPVKNTTSVIPTAVSVSAAEGKPPPPGNFI